MCGRLDGRDVEDRCLRVGFIVGAERIAKQRLHRLGCEDSGLGGRGEKDGEGVSEGESH